jgi:hypothetical protein
LPSILLRDGVNRALLDDKPLKIAAPGPAQPLAGGREQAAQLIARLDMPGEARRGPAEGRQRVLSHRLLGPRIALARPHHHADLALREQTHEAEKSEASARVPRAERAPSIVEQARERVLHQILEIGADAAAAGSSPLRKRARDPPAHHRREAIDQHRSRAAIARRCAIDDRLDLGALAPSKIDMSTHHDETPIKIRTGSGAVRFTARAA